MWFESILRDANYWMEGEICINLSENWGEGEAIAAFTHELGHFYPLHERYLGHIPASCNDSEITIMDTVTTNAAGELVHCDGMTGHRLPIPTV